MPIKARNRLLLTLFTALFLAVASTQASDVRSPLQLREHAHLMRMIRKRVPAPQDGSLIGLINSGAAPEPKEPKEDASSSAKAGSSSAISSSGSSTATGTQSSTGSVPTTSVSSSTESSSSSSSASAPTEAPPETTAPPRSLAIVSTLTETVDDLSQPTSKPPDRQGNASNNNSAPIFTAVIVVAASIGAIAILWTIFRKWKLGSSAKFDKRLDPGWQPDRHQSDDPGIIPHNRRNSGHSVVSGSHHGRGSDHGHASLGPLPDHDFTAGVPGPAPVGGYADLARGHGPQQMREHRQRGNDFNVGGYDTGVPLHHQAGYGSKARFN